jgi:hypothetical protein
MHGFPKPGGRCSSLETVGWEARRRVAVAAMREQQGAVKASVAASFWLLGRVKP